MRPEVDERVAAEHGLTAAEYHQVTSRLGRTPHSDGDGDHRSDVERALFVQELAIPPQEASHTGGPDLGRSR